MQAETITQLDKAYSNAHRLLDRSAAPPVADVKRLAEKIARFVYGYAVPYSVPDGWTESIAEILRAHLSAPVAPSPCPHCGESVEVVGNETRYFDAPIPQSPLPAPVAQETATPDARYFAAPTTDGGYVYDRQLQDDYGAARCICVTKRFDVAELIVNALNAGRPSDDARIERAAQDAAEERQAHITREGWTTEHDDEHTHGEMAVHAARLAVHDTDASVTHPDDGDENGAMATVWPGWGDPERYLDKRRRLVIAASLLIAEIARIDRAAIRDAMKSEGR